MVFDLRLLPAFVVLADELHFGRAAERLNLAQPALSQQVKRLEDQMGVALFLRDRRSVALTAAGRAMLVEARLALAHAERAQAAARRHGVVERAVVRVSLNIDLPRRVVDRARAVLGVLQGLDVRVVRQHQGEALADLRSGTVDLVLGWARVPHGPPLRSSLVDVDELLAVVRHDVALARVGESVTREQFARHRFVMFHRDQSPDLFDWMVAAATGRDRDALEIDEVAPLDDGGAALVAAVATGCGLGLLHAAVFDQAGHPVLHAIPFSPPIHHDITLSWRPEAETPELLRVVAAWG